MAVEDSTILIITALILNYLVVYRLNKIIGSIIFLVIGIATLNLGLTEAPYAFIIMGIGLIGTIYSLTEQLVKR